MTLLQVGHDTGLTARALEEEIESLKDSSDKLLAKNAVLEARLDELRFHQTTVASDMEIKETQLKDLKGRCENLQADLVAARNSVAEEKEKLADISSRADASEASLKQVCWNC